MALRSIALGLVRKTLESDFPKNDTISMRSPSSNASISRGNIFSQELTAACKHIYRALSCERNRNKGVRFQGNRLCGYQIFQLVYNYQIYNLAEIKLSKIFGTLDKF